MATALIVSAAASVAQGAASYQQAKGEQERAEINSYIGRTRALQTDTASREGLEGELGSLRAALGVNQQAPGVGTMAMMDELRKVRGRERRINVGNRNSEAADWRMQGRNAASAGRGALLGGVIGAGPSLFDLYDYQQKKVA